MPGAGILQGRIRSVMWAILMMNGQYEGRFSDGGFIIGKTKKQEVKPLFPKFRQYFPSLILHENDG
jgi:hypothetical protein